MERISDVLCTLGGEPAHWCPACEELHRFCVNAPNPKNGARWTWDGNGERPTFSPSMHLTCGGTIEWPLEVCHYTITAGLIEFHGDCTHAMAGRTGVAIPKIPAIFPAYALKSHP